ncbi:MAG: transcription-repair coupling factor, partial [Alphaproteobacteria bacterium]
MPKRVDRALGGAPEGLDALTVAERLKAEGGVGLFVARDFARMGEFLQAFRFFAGDIEVLEFPAWDCLPYDRLSPTSGVSAQRMAALTALARRQAGDSRALLVVTTVSAAMQRTPPREVTCGAGFETTVGLDLDTAALERYFAANGYVRASTVSERGEFAVRGGVVDVFPPGFEEPVRLDMFGSELESIRTFDPATQRSTGQLTSVSLAPVSEALLDPDSISRFRTG